MGHLNRKFCSTSIHAQVKGFFKGILEYPTQLFHFIMDESREKKCEETMDNQNVYELSGYLGI